MRRYGCAAIIPAISTAVLAAAIPQPNIVFILADDLGWSDLGCQGSKFYETPAIDRLASEGMRFTHAYAAGPNCQPTRAALMSGQYGPRTGVYTVGGTDRFDTSMRPLVPVENVTSLSPSVITVAESLREVGYATALFGKWHLGENPECLPSAQGFDEAIVSKGRHFNFRTKPPTNVPSDAYLADFLTDRAIDFIERRRGGPFFLYLSHFAVHTPLEAKPETIERFKNKPPAGGHYHPVYAGMVASLDESVGRVVAALHRLGLSSNTLVVFSSDNGGVGGYLREGLGISGVTDNAPLRHGKGSLYEGGVRVPLIARWPGRIAAGRLCDVPVISVDFAPTFRSLAGAPAPTGQPQDGVDITPLFEGRTIPPRDLYWHFPGYLGSGHDLWRTPPVSAIRRGPYKLMEFLEDGRLELYDVVTDMGQTNNLAAAQPALAAELRRQLVAWREAIGAPMPTRRAAAGSGAASAEGAETRAKRAAEPSRPRRRSVAAGTGS